MKKIRSILCLLLVLAMALSLAACGNKEQGSAKPDQPQQEETPEYGYKTSFRELNVPEDSYLNLQVYTDKGFYATSYEKTGQRELREGEVLDYEGQLDIYSTRIYYVPFDGQPRLLEAYEPIPAAEDTENRTNYGSGCDVQALVLREDGKLLSLDRAYENWFDGTPEEANSDSEDNYDKWRYTSSYYMRVLNEDGSEESCVRLDYKGDMGDDYLNFFGAQLDEAGNLLGLAGTKLIAFAPDGTAAYTIESDDYFENMVQLRDGRIALSISGENGMELFTVDTEKHELGERIEIPRNAYYLLPGSGDYDFYYRDGSSLYAYSAESGESEKLLNFINCDVNGDYLNGLRVDDQGNVSGVHTQWTGEERSVEYVTLSRVPADSLPQKETIRMAVMWLDQNLSDQVINFNRHSDDVRVEIVDYSEFNTEDDYEAGRTKLLTEIMSGNMPDLFVLQQLPYRQLAAKGLLEDLYPYLDADPELSREDFFPTVLKAMENNGKLCRLCPSFTIMTLLAAESLVGSEPGWTYDEFRAALASMPEGCTPVSESMARPDVLQLLLNLDMDQFVDWNTGKCSFDSQEFIDLLNFTNLFQAEYNWDPDFDWSTWESDEQRIAAGKQMCMASAIYSVDSVLYNDFYFGGSATYIGWPTNSGVGNALNLGDTAFAMGTNCANKDAAWKFLRTLLMESYQDQVWSLPVNVHSFDKQVEKAMTPEYMKDAEGNILLDENGEKKMISKGGVGMADGSVHEIYAMTQEQADKLMQVINTTERSVEFNDSIYDIVLEQAEAFFQGQKSAEEVARLIQSKANIYVNEQR